MLEDLGVQGGGRVKGKSWENRNSIINKIYFKKKERKKKQEPKGLVSAEFGAYLLVSPSGCHSNV